MWMRWHWIIWFLELDTCKSQKQQSNFAWFCLVLQITHQFEKEVTKQSVIDCSWNDLDFCWLLSVVHKLLPWNLKGYNLKWLRTLSFETSYWTFFFVLHWLFSRRRNKAYKCPRIVWRTDYSCSIGTTDAPTRPSQNVRQGIVLEVSPASASMNEESGQQLNLKVPKGGLVLKMCMVYVSKSSWYSLLVNFAIVWQWSKVMSKVREELTENTIIFKTLYKTLKFLGSYASICNIACTYPLSVCFSQENKIRYVMLWKS